MAFDEFGNLLASFPSGAAAPIDFRGRSFLNLRAFGLADPVAATVTDGGDLSVSGGSFIRIEADDTAVVRRIVDAPGVGAPSLLLMNGGPANVVLAHSDLLNMPGDQNVTIAAGDVVQMVLASGVWRLVGDAGAAMLSRASLKTYFDTLYATPAAVTAAGISQLVGQSSLSRPGEAVQLFSATLAGRPEDKSSLGDESGVSVVNSATLGRAIEVSGAEVIVARRQPVAIEPGRIYRPEFDVIRATDPADPAGHSVRLGISWQGGAFSELQNDILLTETRPVAAGQWRPALGTWSLDMPEADNVIPGAANYAAPYVQTFGTDGAVRIGQVGLRDVTDDVLGAARDTAMRDGLANGFDASILPDRLRVDETSMPYALAAKHGGKLIDFTNRAAVPFANGADIEAVMDAAGGVGMIPTASDRRPVVDIYRGRRVARSEAVGTRLKVAGDGNLLPPMDDMTLIFSHVVTGEGRKASIWQHASEGSGRVQITANGQYNGEFVVGVAGRMNFFLDGAADGGSGFSGQPVSAAHPIGVPSTFALVMRSGTGASELWQDGQIIDRFTRPAALLDSTGYLFSHASVDAYDASGQAFGRVAVLHAALDANELASVGAWVADGLGLEWQKAASPSVDYANHALSLFDQGDAGDVWDFTSPETYGRVQTSNTIAIAAGLRPEPVRLVPTQSTSAPMFSRVKGHLAIEATDGARLRREDFEPILPGPPMTLVFSHRVENSARKAILWQHASGAAGRVQITANARYTGAALSEAAGSVQFFIDGISDGHGANGQPRTLPHPVGYASTFALVLRPGTGASELWQDGKLADTFTAPPVVYQDTGYIFSHSAVAGYDESGQSLGRMMVIGRPLSEGEIRLAGKWCAEAVGMEWQPAATSASDLSTPITADGAVVMYVPSFSGGGDVELYSKDPDAVRHPASLTKVMTAMVMLDNLSDMAATFTVEAGDATGGSGNNLQTGDVISASDALYNMMLPSSNVTTSVVARSIGETLAGGAAAYDKFVAAMNAKAAALGMASTNFTNASGLDNSGMVTTPRDMAKMFMAALDYPEILARWGAATHDITITGPNARTESVSHSLDLIENGDADAIGGKTGTTAQAGSSLGLLAAMPNGNRVMVLIIGSTSDANRYADARAVMSAVRDAYQWPAVLPVRK